MKKYKFGIIFIVIIIISLVFVKQIKNSDNIEYIKYKDVAIHSFDDLKYDSSKKKYSLKKGTLNYFDVAYDETGSLMFLVNGVSWDLDGKSTHSMIERLEYKNSNEYSWDKYYTSSSTAKSKYSNFTLFKNDLDLYIKSACQVKKDFLREKNNMDTINAFNEKLCVEKGIVSKLSFVACSSYDKSFPTLTLVTDTGTKEFGYLYYNENARIVDLGEGNCQNDDVAWVPGILYQRAIDSENKNKACNYFKELYNAGLLDRGDFETIPAECSIDKIKQESDCQKKSENHYVDNENLRVGRCSKLEQEIPEEDVDLSKCINYDESVSLLEIGNYKFAYSYQVGKGSMILEINATEKNNCLDERNVWVYPEIVNKALENGKSVADVCNYFKDLYNEGLLDQGDYNSATSNFCNITNKTFDVCQSKGVNHFVDSKNIRIDSCEPEDKNFCSTADYSTMLLKTSENKKYNVGFISEGPKFYVGECSNSYSVSGIINQFDGGCDFVKGLAKKGILTSAQVNEAKANGCSINITDKSCKVVVTPRNNSIYSFDGHYVTKSTYDDRCKNDFSDPYAYVKDEDIIGSGEQINKTCNYSVDSSVTNTSIIIGEEEEYNHENIDEFALTDNEYCKVTCQEKFAYTYPNIFESVKSGTYFNFMYNPEVFASRTCKTDFNYTDWKKDYKKAIEDELEALNDWLISKTLDEKSETRYRTCVEDGVTTTCSYTHRWYNFSELNCDGNNRCRVETYTDRDDMSEPSYTRVSDAKMRKIYENRKKLETFNVGCYTALDNLENKSNILGSATNGFLFDEENVIFNNMVTMDSYNLNLSGSDFKYLEGKIEGSDVNAINFYQIDPKIKFKYEYKDGEYKENELKVSSKRLVKDTGAYTSRYTDPVTGLENYVKNNNTERFSFSINGTPYSFDAFTITSVSRYVSKYYDYKSNNEYYIDYKNNAEGELCSDSCSSKSVLLGNVYPVSLVTEGQKKAYFSIYGVLGHKGKFSSKLSGELENLSGNVYSCDYQVINDVLKTTEENKLLGNKNYKANFFTRVISTSDVDPNDRYSLGLLGSNWSSEKGQALIKIIEEKSKGNNTYNPSNLEYSFTLNAQSIEAIRTYNNTHPYSDFNLECNNMGGECKSKFLDNLAGKVESGISTVDGIKVNNVNAEMSRKNWKYYINGSWFKTETITKNSNWINVFDNKNIDAALLNKLNTTCDAFYLEVKNYYECIYKYINEGVLP